MTASTDENPTDGLKLATARTIKWNLVDRLGQQVLYGVTGIVLARLLSQEDFGLVGAILIFQAFASLLVDSGFSYALLQRKQPSRLDYSTVLWFNLGLSSLIYIILWCAAPFIATLFDDNGQLVPLSRVMFLTFILNASAIVQTNRLMKRMSVKMVAVSNIAGLAVGAVAGIWLALTGYGAWAIVWQSVAAAAVKSAVLWLTGNWLPELRFSLSALRSYFAVGSGMMLTSFLNTLFQKIYAFFIGHRAGLVPLGYYTQSDKWSTMGVASLSQVVTASFLPLLSAVQDDKQRFARVASKTNRFTAYILFPSLAILAVLATPLFHLLFGTKWDASIVLFQLLLGRGVFAVLIAQHNNAIIALGKTRLIFYLEALRDTLAIVALLATLTVLTVERPDDIVYGIRVMLWWQVAATAVAWAATMIVASREARISVMCTIGDLAPFLLLTAMSIAVMLAVPESGSSIVTLLSRGLTGAGCYILLNYLTKSKIQQDTWEYISHRFKHRKKK